MTPPKPTLSTGCTDEELSAAVAQHVAGLTPDHFKFNYDGETTDHCCWRRDGKTIGSGACPPFATSADCVLPLLEKHHPWRADCGGEYGYRLSISALNAEHVGTYSVAWGSTFARAACFCILRAAGVTIEEK